MEKISDEGQPDAPSSALATSDAWTSGTLFGDLKLLSKAHAGFSSVIYKARHVVSGRYCALKLFRPELGISAVGRGRILRVANKIDSLGMSGIAATYDGGLASDGKTTYSVQQWIEGTALRDLFKESKPLSRRLYLSVMRQACHILSVAHGSLVPHLTLHGGNIILQSADEVASVTLLDFGVREVHPKPGEQISAMERRPQDAYYLAPEQIRGESGDHRSDIYSLCTLLYHMTTGSPPHRGTTFDEVASRQLADKPRDPGSLASMPSELETTILAGLDKDPAKRMPSVEALLAALDPLSTITGKHRTISRQAAIDAVASSSFSERRNQELETQSSDRPTFGNIRSWRLIAGIVGAIVFAAAVILLLA